MSKTVIQVNNLSKRYRIGLKEKRHDTFVGQLGAVLKAPIDNFRRLRSMSKFGTEDESVFWALKDINFEVKEGEVLGIIGHNGAGKSTLLKILSRITEPTSGEIKIKGRISALLEVGTGFHPDLTGRENVYMNGTILGMTKREIDAKFDEIIDFSGVEKYIDTPVKFYSSGMKVRLGFAVAAHLEPEILIIDEVLAVGDAEFQRKCLGKMESVAGEGRTVLFVSHNMAAVENLCSKALVLNRGTVLTDGEIRSVIRIYLDNLLTKLQPEGQEIPINIPRRGSQKIIFTSFFLRDEKGNLIHTIQSGMLVYFNFGYRISSNIIPLKNIDIGFSLHTLDDSTIFVLYSSYTAKKFNVAAKEGFFSCKIHSFPLTRGVYKIKARISVNEEECDFPLEGLGKVEVEDGDFFGTGVMSSKNTRVKPILLINGEWDNE